VVAGAEAAAAGGAAGRAAAGDGVTDAVVALEGVAGNVFCPG
jgi:hypothetical protein